MRDRRLQAIRLNAGIVAKIIFAIVWKVQGTFEPGIGWLILMLAVSLWVPMGFTISFVICKLVGVLALGWPWIILTLILDGLMIDFYSSITR